jgi:hypothetical protein
LDPGLKLGVEATSYAALEGFFHPSANEATVLRSNSLGISYRDEPGPIEWMRIGRGMQ